MKIFDNRHSQCIYNNVTGVETRLYYYDVMTKSQNIVSVFEDDDASPLVRKSRSVKK